MPPALRLWKITVTCALALAEAVEDVLTDDAVAVTSLAPPRRAMAQIEALYNEEPDKAVLNELRVKLAVLAALHRKDSPSPAKTKDLQEQAQVFASSPPSGVEGFLFSNISSKTKMPRICVEEIRNLNWLKKVAADFPPLAIGRWTIYGNAHRHAVKDRRMKLRIDATNAFGTGEHPTTRGCLLMLDRVLKKGIGIRTGTLPLREGRNRLACHSLVSDRGRGQKKETPSPAKTKALRCNAKFLLPLPQGERAFFSKNVLRRA